MNPELDSPLAIAWEIRQAARRAAMTAGRDRPDEATLADWADRLEEVELAAPAAARRSRDTPRNCDVGTAEEQDARFGRFCDARKYCTGCPVKEEWPPKPNSCGVIWGQLPYVAQAGGDARVAAADKEGAGE